MGKGQLELKLSEVKESENDFGKWEHYTFTAYDRDLPVARIGVDKLKEVKDRELSDDNFLIDSNFNPARPRPYLFGMHTDKNYRGEGIAGNLIKLANEYFKKQYGTPLHSGVINKGSAPRVWEKLVDEKKAIEYDYEKDRRWAML